MNYDRNRLQKLAFQAAENAHQDAKRNNTWFSYGKDDRVIREYPDGRKTEVIRKEDGSIQEIEFTEEAEN